MREITIDSYDAFIQEADRPILLEFTADWCGPCAQLRPLVKQLETRLADRILFGAINVDEEEELADRFHVASIPTLLLLRGETVVGKLVGTRPYEELVDAVERLLHV